MDYFENFKNELEQNFNKYQYIICVSINRVKSKQIQDIRKFLRNRATILIERRSLINYYLKHELLYLYKSWGFLIKNIKGNVGMIFTDEDPRIINKILNRFYLSAPAFAGHISTKNIKIKKGIKPLSPSQTPFFQALGIPTRISKGSIDIIDNLLFVRKKEMFSVSHVVLLNKLGIKPFRYGMKIVNIFKKKLEIKLSYLKIDNNQINSNISHIIKKNSATEGKTIGFSKSHLSYNIYLINRNIQSFLISNADW
ncbi:60S acidic ribosomal protein P0 (nucleomorph) [Lotharella oceanica]|uniref:60S acidic ribosomal protein P0 n=1 Tax=Lotharella oceanica TaxID=641309 RepID=A0A060DAW5_9EUKA|nr:60S acidic ribosomal protein P0 [Lotharella oceanica]